ncbi:hypothetical protein ACA086_03970 [Muriicola sp. E247]|uniref:hypothetical protein n=1 Tax=Muriicola sp. E247 TaxID=3242730 RepID=UPI00352436E0
MKFILAFVLTFFAIASGSANCNNAYASAGYSLSHAKNSMEANNFEHQQYYAERALSAFEKAKTQNENCGCQKAINPILDGIENLESALNQEKWDMGRFYTKKALENAEQLLNNLDVCTMGDIYQETPEETSAENPLKEIIATDSKADELADWEIKMNYKQQAEAELAELERTIRELGKLFHCEKAMQILVSRKLKTENELRAESLESIRAFYMSQAVAMHNKALFAMIECSKKLE